MRHISILRGLKERYEVFHGVKITDSALVAAAMLSNRYISDRFLPDKAIDLVDEACALIKTELDSMPTELDELRRRIMQLEIEEDSLKKEELVYKILDEQAIAGATKKVAADKLKEERKGEKQKRSRVTVKTVKKEGADKVFSANKNGDLTKAKTEEIPEEGLCATH